ncbi:MAG TPA: PQQ-binding-like beta-propeller repeat protein [Vicinamibacterales bacterium]|nr:PQQ-binding-like beta-propeller repeat protein [Vicinamibacterales bacterium]
MSRKFLQLVPALGLLAIGLVWLAPKTQGQAMGQPSWKDGDWPTFTAQLNGCKCSAGDQINASNFNKLEVAWRFKTDNLGPRAENKLEGTPLEVRGTVYATAGTRKSVVALDGRTGELKWAYGLDEGERAQWSPRALSGRGLAYWTDGRGDERILYTTIGYQLVELNAKTGQPVASFGKNGILDLKVGVLYGKFNPKTLKYEQTQIDLTKGEIGWHSAPTVVGDMVIVGSSMAEGLGYTHSDNAKGLARAFDVKTGKQVWRFNTMPGPGEFGHDTWEENSWDWTGNTGVWTQISVDPELGMVYLPVETPTIDEYGGNRPGNNLFAESLVAVDMKTGVRKWHFQMVHHGLWDYDNSSASLLMDVNIDGRPRKVVAQPTKQGWLYVFDRITGEPIWPIEERPVPQSDIPGEKTSKTQPYVTKPPAYSRTFVGENDVIDFTPALHQQALDNLKNYRWEKQMFTPPAYIRPGGPQGSVNIANASGGVNWPGSAFDPDTGIFYTQAGNSAVTTGGYTDAQLAVVSQDGQTKTSGGRLAIWEDPNGRGGRGREAGPGAGAPGGAAGAGRGAGAGAGGGRGGRAGADAAAAPGAPAAGGRAGAPAAGAQGGGGRGGMTAGLNGLPIVKPPYGVVTALDVNKGTMLWQKPHGDTPDNVRATLQQMGINYPEKTGQGGSLGSLVTKNLFVVGDAQVTTTPEHPRGAMLRAYNKQTGEEVGHVLMPAQQSGSPMSYTWQGKQYIVVAISGGAYTGEYIAFALPNSVTGN